MWIKAATEELTPISIADNEILPTVSVCVHVQGDNGKCIHNVPPSHCNVMIESDAVFSTAKIALTKKSVRCGRLVISEK